VREQVRQAISRSAVGILLPEPHHDAFPVAVEVIFGDVEPPVCDTTAAKPVRPGDRQWALTAGPVVLTVAVGDVSTDAVTKLVILTIVFSHAESLPNIAGCVGFI
jgi:hypothetical protein